MSGGASAATIAAVVGAGAAVGGLGYSMYAGQNQAGQQDAALKRQKTAQEKAEGAALSTERQGAMAQNAANTKTPDIAGILARASQLSKGGVGGTMLTGPTGVNTSSLPLGKSTLLGS